MQILPLPEEENSSTLLFFLVIREAAGYTCVVITPDETWRTKMTDMQKYAAAAEAIGCPIRHIHYILGRSIGERIDSRPEVEIDRKGINKREDLLLYYLAHVREDADYKIKEEELSYEYPGYIADTLKKFKWHVERGDRTFRRMGEGLHVALYFAKVLMRQVMESKKLKGKVRVIVSAQYTGFKDSLWKVEAQNMIEGNMVCFYISPEVTGQSVKWKVQLWVARREWKGLTKMDTVSYRVSEDVVRNYCKEACIYLAVSDSIIMRKRSIKKSTQGKILNNVGNYHFRDRET